MSISFNASFVYEIIVHLNEGLCELKLLTIVLFGRLFYGLCWEILMLFDHSLRILVALHHDWGGKMTSTIE
jgi:uncharacterized protein involved in cysteine biosynthesis